MRNFIQEFENYTIKSNSINSEKQEGFQWVKKADWYNPFIEKAVKLLCDIDRDTLKFTKRGYW